MPREKKQKTVQKGGMKTNVKISTLFQKNANRVTTITVTPRRLTDDEQDCVYELNAFARGGTYAMTILQKVYMNILAKYNVDIGDMHDILLRAGLYLDTHYRVKAIVPTVEAEEYEEKQLKISDFFNDQAQAQAQTQAQAQAKAEA